MGTKISVSSVTLPIMEAPDNPAIAAVFYAIMKRFSIASSLVRDALNSMAFRVNRIHAYARDHYTLGLPEGRHGSTYHISDVTLAPIIATDLGIANGVAIDYSIMANLDYEMVMLPQLIDLYDYDPTTNRLGTWPALMPEPPRPTTAIVTVYLMSPAVNNEDVEVTYKVFTPATYTSVWNAEDERYENVLKDAEVTSYYSEDLTMMNTLLLGKPYVVAKYFELDGGGSPIPGNKFWYYNCLTEVYTALNINRQIDDLNTFLPVVPLRYNNVSLNSPAHKTTDLYITSRRLLKKVDIDIDDLIELVDSNPSIADIDHAYIAFGIDVGTDKEASLAYLCDFFDYIKDIDSFDQYDTIEDIQNTTQEEDNTYSIYADVAASGASANYDYPSVDVDAVNDNRTLSLTEHGLDITLSYKHISSTIKAGTIGTGKVGSATKSIGVNESAINAGGLLSKSVDNSTLTLKRQLTPTTYREVVITGLVHTNRIYGGYSHITRLGDVSASNHNFFIPLHYGVAKQMTIRERNTLYKESFQMVINSIEITDVEWYETGLFKFILMVIAVIITVWSGQAWVAELAAAIDTGILAVLYFILVETILVGLVITEVANFIINEIGGELGIVLAVVLAVWAMTKGKADGFTIAKSFIPTAQALMAASNALIKAVGEFYKEQITNIGAELEAFKTESEKQQEELDEIIKLLDTRSMFDPLTFTDNSKDYIQVSNEAVGTFYNRTIHSGNIGVKTLDVIGNYHSMMLTLPKIGTDPYKMYLG